MADMKLQNRTFVVLYAAQYAKLNHNKTIFFFYYRYTDS